MVHLETDSGEGLSYQALTSLSTLVERARYLAMLETDGVPLLRDVWQMDPYKGEVISLVKEKNQLRVKSHVPVAKLLDRTLLTGDKVKALQADEAEIIAAIDATLSKQGKRRRKTLTDINGAGFWQISANSERRASAVFPITNFTEDGKCYRVDDFNRDVGGVLPLSITNFGAVDDDGYNHACDIIVMDESGKIVTIDRYDMPDRKALMGGLSEGHMKMNVSNVVLELLEEGLVSSVIGSAHFKKLIREIPVANEQFIEIATEYRFEVTVDAFDAYEKIVKELDDQSRKDESYRQRNEATKVKLTIAFMGLAESLYSEKQAGYQPTFELLKAAMKPVTDKDGEQLNFINIGDHRTSRYAAAKSAVYHLVISSSLVEALKARDLQFKAGDDAKACQFVSIFDFLQCPWGGHGGLLIEVCRVLHEKKTTGADLSAEETFLLDTLFKEISSFEQSKQAGFLQVLTHLSEHLLNIVLNFVDPDEKNKASSVKAYIEREVKDLGSYNQVLTGVLSQSRQPQFSDVITVIETVIKPALPENVSALEALSNWLSVAGHEVEISYPPGPKL